MRFPVVQAIGLQSVSPILLFGLTILISRFFGPEELGVFGTTKAWFDVLIAAGCFGFPQSVVLAINRGNASRWQLYRATVLYSLVLVPAFVVGSLASNYGDAIFWVAPLAMSVGAACMVANKIWRGILLTLDDGYRFHLITVIPGFTLVVIVLAVLVLRGGLSPELMFYSFGGAGILAVVLSLVVFPLKEARQQDGKKPDYRMLSTNGLDVFIQALTTVLQAYICLEWLKRNSGMIDVGYLTSALVVYTACTFPIQAVAPMILNRWSKGTGLNALVSGRSSVRRFALVAAIGLAVMVLFVPWGVPVIFGESFTGAVLPVQIILTSTYAAFWFRLGSLRLASIAKFRAISFAAVLRLSLIVVLLLPVTHFLGAGNAVTAVALCWLFGEAAAAVVTKIAVGRYLAVFDRVGMEDQS